MDALEAIRTEKQALQETLARNAARREQIDAEISEHETQAEMLRGERRCLLGRESEEIGQRIAALERAESVLIEHQPVPVADPDPEPTVAEDAPTDAPVGPALPESTGRTQDQRNDGPRASSPRTSVALVEATRTWKPGQKTTKDAVDTVVMLLEDLGQASQTELVDGVMETLELKQGTASGYVSGALLYLRSEGLVTWLGREDRTNRWELKENADA